MTLDTSNVQHEKLVIRLVDPVIHGFSVPPAPAKPVTPAKRPAGGDEESVGRKKSKQ
jgi:hypothetical protein